MSDTNNTQHIDIDYVCNLARLELHPQDKQELSGQLENIVNYLETLNEVDITGVQPMAHAFPLTNVWQEDEPKGCFTPEEALLNAPAKRNNQIIVPKVVE